MKLKREYVGQIRLGNLVDITDPCYDKDTWCRMQAKIKPGTYNCYSYIGEAKGWGKRVWINQIVISDDDDATITEKKVKNNRSWRKIGEIGVDAGLAGFFNDKPDFGDDAWHEFCEWMYNEENQNVYDSFIRRFDSKDGFWTHSGAGDGCYSVHAIRNDKRQIVALEIRF